MKDFTVRERLGAMVGLSEIEWLLVSIAAVMIGLTKTGMPGLGILYAPLMAEIFPARASVGIVLPMLMFADLFSIGYYRRHVVWSYLLRLLPWTGAGIFIGYLALGKIDDELMQPLFGITVLAMLGISQWLRKEERLTEPKFWFAAITGLLAGVITMMTNAAGPIMVIYLSAMRLPKSEFMGTGAWYFLILNWFKVPFSLSLGLITSSSLQLNIVSFPIIAFGAISGTKVLKHISTSRFSAIVQILAAASAIKLLLG